MRGWERYRDEGKGGEGREVHRQNGEREAERRIERRKREDTLRLKTDVGRETGERGKKGKSSKKDESGKIGKSKKSKKGETER